MTTFLIILAVMLPLPWVSKLIWPHQVTLLEAAASVGASAIVIAITYFAGQAGMTWDTEIWNGKIVSKNREHGHYLEAYSCNCRQVCSGSGKNRSCSTTCDTCYRDHYTVKWTAASTIGTFHIDGKDWTSSAVYKVPDPERYASIQKDDPCSRTSSFTNYVKAVPESLFHANPLLQKRFENMIPEYPLGIYDIYRLDRAIPVGVSVPDLKQWNQDISGILRELGPQKQANIIVLFVNTPDSSYQQALEAAWIGGKKNDIIVILGTTQYPKIDWAAVSSWSKSETFKVQLRDEILDVGEVRREAIIPLIEKNTLKYFERRHMKEFEYLKDEIEPPIWVLVLAVVLGIAFSLGASYLFSDTSINQRRRSTGWR